MKRFEYKMGVTLVEMLIVIAIVMILASLVIGMANQISNQSRSKSLENTFGVLESALDEYREHTGYFPEQPDRLPAEAVVHSQILYTALDAKPSSRKVLEQISNSLIEDRADDGQLEIYDPWGTVLDYIYESGNDSFPELISAGPDRNFDSPDDISSRRK
ncbi:MAG: type II secretion system protein [Planctomycetota bacterium]|jgi:type II secretory pathway pseudopilin PulG